MLDTLSTLQSKVIDLAGDAFTGFCEDIGGMFGVDMSCDQVSVTEKPAPEIKKHYKKVAAVYSVESTGSFNGDFKICFDKAGLFTLAGVVVMLPESRILSNAKRGTLANGDEMSDAVGEVGNLLVGCWGRIFRNGMGDKTHFTHTGTFIGDLGKEGSEATELSSDEEAIFVSFEMSVGDYPSFQCGAHFPARFFAEAKSEPKLEAEAEQELASETEVESKVDSQDVIEPDAETEVVSKPEPKADAAVIAEPEEDVLAATEPDAPEDAAVSEPTKLESESTSDSSAESQEKSPASETVDPVIATPKSVLSNSDAPLTASHLMQTEVHWISADETVDEARTKMQQLGVSYLLVGNSAKLDGIVTQSDLASAASIYLRPIFAKWRRPEDDATLQIRIKWIMSKQIYTVKVDTPLANIIHLTCKYDISCLPVVNVQGEVLGVVTTTGVFKAIVSNEISITGVMVA